MHISLLSGIHIVKRAALDVVPREILARKKQPYRAPDALSFVAADAPAYVEEALSEGALREANVFEPQPVRQLLAKCRARADDGQFSNADNMALVGVLSTQLLHRRLVASRPRGDRTARPRTDVDHTIRETT